MKVVQVGIGVRAALAAGAALFALLCSDPAT